MHESESESEVLSHIWRLGTPWIAAYQAPPSMGFSRQEYWSEAPVPSPNFYLDVSIKKKENTNYQISLVKEREDIIPDSTYILKNNKNN